MGRVLGGRYTRSATSSHQLTYALPWSPQARGKRRYYSAVSIDGPSSHGLAISSDGVEPQSERGRRGKRRLHVWPEHLEFQETPPQDRRAGPPAP